MNKRWFAVLGSVFLVLGLAILAFGLQTRTPQNPEALKFRRKIGSAPDRIVVGNSTLYELDKTNGRVLGKLFLNAPISSNPLVVDDITYVTSSDGFIRAVKNGAQIWKAKLQDLDASSHGDEYELFFSGDYLVASGPDITCLQRSTGNQIFKLKLTGKLKISGDRLFVCTSDEVSCVDLSTGKNIWKTQESFSDRGAGPLFIQDDVLYVSHGDDGVYKFDLATGRTIWKKENHKYKIIWEPIISLPGGQIAAKDENGELDIFNCDSGKSFKYAPADHPPIPTDPMASLFSHVDVFVVDHDVLYAGGNGGGSGIGGFMAAFDPITKTQKWLSEIKEQSIHVAIPAPAAFPVLYHDQVIFQLDAGTIYALNAKTGKLCWKTDTTRGWQSWGGNESPTIFLSVHTACVYNFSGLTAVDASTGKKQWAIDIPETFAPIQDGNRLYVETISGAAYAVDLGTGTVVWSFAADGAQTTSGAVAVHDEDAQTFSPAAWINIKKEWNWSRQKLMEQFCNQYRYQLDQKKMNRAKVIAILGDPEMSYEYPDAKNISASGQIPRQITDYYQLSEKAGTFEVSYDEQGIVNRYNQSDHQCIFEDFIEPAHANSLTNATLENARKVSDKGFDSIVKVEKLLGPPAKSEVNILPESANPSRSSSYYWNLSANGRQILWVGTNGMFSEDLDKRRVGVVCIITLSPDCPIK